jgi:aminopeptidase N
VSAGRRGLKNLALAYLVDGGDRGALDLARRQLAAADNLTDRYAALAAIVHSEAGFKAEVLLLAAREWHTEPLLMNKWLALQASAPAHAGEPPVLERVRILMRHAAYSESNPNSVHALVLGFCNNNPAEFHRRDGSGYVFWVDQVLRLDRINPIVAARIARSLERWRRFTPDRRRMMREALEQVSRAKTLSRDVREIVGRALAP